MGFSPQKVLYWGAKLIRFSIQQIILRFQFTNIKQFCTFGGGCFNTFCLYCSVFSAIAHDIHPLHLSSKQWSSHRLHRSTQKLLILGGALVSSAPTKQTVGPPTDFTDLHRWFECERSSHRLHRIHRTFCWG